MKTLWNSLAIIAIANLFAIGFFIAWLGASRRLNPERVEAVRLMFQETVAEEAARLAKEEAERKAAEAAAKAQELPVGPPVGAQETLALRLQASELDLQRLARLRQEVDALQSAVQRERRLLDEDRETFQKERDAFAEMRKRIEEQEKSAQFQKALSTLAGMKAADAKATLSSLLEQGKRDEVIGYLDKMEERIRTKVVSEFVKDEESELAAQLLEELRVRGIFTPGP